jgi:lipopolysaccharide export system permease protein
MPRVDDVPLEEPDPLKLIDRHLLREFIIPLMICLTAFTGLFILFDVFSNVSEFNESQTPFILIVRYYFCMIAPTMQYLLPASMLLATLYTLWQFSKSSELVAMRACGISLRRILTPFILAGILTSLMLSLSFETFIPTTYEWAVSLSDNDFVPIAKASAEHVNYVNSHAHRYWEIGRIDKLSPDTLYQVTVTQELPNHYRLYVIDAPQADYLDGQWWFTSPTIQRFGDSDNPIGEAVPYGPATNSVVQAWDFDEHPSIFTMLRTWEFRSAREMWRYLGTNPELSATSLKRKRYDFHARLAMPWGCLMLTLFAIPAGARTGRQGIMPAVFTAIALMVGYYAMSSLGLLLAPATPAWLAAWLANIISFTGGIALLARMR